MQLPLVGAVPAVIAFLVAEVKAQDSQVSADVSIATLRMPRVHAAETATLNSPLGHGTQSKQLVNGSNSKAIDESVGTMYLQIIEAHTLSCPADNFDGAASADSAVGSSARCDL